MGELNGDPSDPGAGAGFGWLWRRLRDRTAGLVRTLGAMLQPGRAERELDEEHAFHIEKATEKLVAGGLDPAEARRQARVAFGGVERWQEEVREARWTAGLNGLWRDARFSARSLRARPLFTGVVVLTLAVSIGAVTAVFGLVDTVLLRPLDVPEPGRLVGLEVRETAGGVRGAVSYPDYVDLRAGAVGGVGSGGAAAFSGLAAHYLSDIALNAGERATAALGIFASADYFGVLGLVPAAGRFFTADESAPETAVAVAVISWDVWQSRYGGAPDVVGRDLHVNGRPLTIVGVLPEGFRGAMLGALPAAWLPVGLYPELHPGQETINSRTTRPWLQVFGRLSPGVTEERAASVLSTVAAGMAQTYNYPEEVEPAEVTLKPFKGLPPTVQDNARLFLLLLLTAAGLLLLIAAVNVAGMLLARGTARSREMGVRKALGAGRGRLIRQLSVESLVLGLVGAAGGVGVAALATQALGSVQPPGAGDNFALDIAIDGLVMAFAFGAGVVAALVFGLLPAMRATASDVRTAVSENGGAPSSTRLRNLLVGGQVALTLVLLVSTALLVRTLRSAAATDHGFDSEGVVLAEVNLRLNNYDEPRGLAFYDRLLERLEAAPEVETATMTTSIPLGLGFDGTWVQVPGFEAPEPGGFAIGYAAVDSDYFATLRLPLRAGRTFNDADVVGPTPLVINQAFAERFWPDGNAVGQLLTSAGSDAVVVGVVPGGKYRSFSEPEHLFAYLPFQRSYSPESIVLFRPATTLGPAVTAFRRILAELDPNVPAVDVTTLERAMGQSLFLQQVAATLVGLFAAVGLILAATGIFGLLAFLVEQRRKEIGVRMAIGASAGGIVRSVVGAGLRPVLAGTVVGLASAAAATGVLTGLLHGVTPRDPLSFAAAAAILIVVAAAAAFFPARRATRVNPASVLRVE